MKLVAAWLRIPFWQRVVAGFVLGAVAGWLMGPAAGTWLKPLGDLYVTLIKMIAVPLVFFAVINAVSSLHGQKSVAALGGRTFLWFAATAALAVCVGLAVGWVVQPGKDVIEIVPLEDNLLLEARVQPRDIAFLRPGQKVVVKFTAYDFSIYGGLDGKLEHIGADSVVDEKGNAYYTVRVRTNKPTLGNNLPVIPGMIVEVDIITGEKSVLTYLLKPVLRAKARALSER